MLVKLKDAATGDIIDAKVHKNDLIIKLKSFIQSQVKKTKDKLITLSFEETELEDIKFIGHYKAIKDNSIISYHVPVTQPYSKTKYSTIEAKLERTIRKKPLEAFFDPTDNANDWIGEWNKGNEYLNYPPISYNDKDDDLIGKLGQYEVESSKQAEFYDSFEKYMKKMLKRGRSFSSSYYCQVKGFKYGVLHKLEGKWSGTAVQYSSPVSAKNSEDIEDNEAMFKHKINSCSSKLFFDSQRKVWVEIQTFTQKVGLSRSTIFQYIPSGDHVLQAVCDDKRLMERVRLKLKEDENDNSLTLIGTSIETNKIVLTETIIFNGDLRTRTITRFDNEGKFVGVVICSEQKVIDEETGAITPFS